MPTLKGPFGGVVYSVSGDAILSVASAGKQSVAGKDVRFSVLFIKSKAGVLKLDLPYCTFDTTDQNIVSTITGKLLVWATANLSHLVTKMAKEDDGSVDVNTDSGFSNVLI